MPFHSAYLSCMFTRQLAMEMPPRVPFYGGLQKVIDSILSNAFVVVAGDRNAKTRVGNAFRAFRGWVSLVQWEK